MAVRSLPKSRKEAKAVGAKKYFTGLPCKYGHVAPRNLHGACTECNLLRAKAHYNKVATDPDFKETRAKRRRDNVVRSRRHRQKRREEHAGRPKTSACEVCGSEGQTSYDHCHFSGRFRGWLCGGCNQALGAVNDDPAVLRALADYVEKHNGRLSQGDWIERERARKILGKARKYGSFVPPTN
jgi:hypothetical protein